MTILKHVGNHFQNNYADSIMKQVTTIRKIIQCHTEIQLSHTKNIYWRIIKYHKYNTYEEIKISWCINYIICYTNKSIS